MEMPTFAKYFFAPLHEECNANTFSWERKKMWKSGFICWRQDEKHICFWEKEVKKHFIPFLDERII